MTEPKLAKPLTISRWLMGGIVTSSIVGGGLFAIAALFLIQPSSPDPAIQDNEDTAVVSTEVNELKKETAELKQQIGKMQAAPTATESRATQIMVGLTQLKTAYETDTPLQYGIETLKRSIPDTSLQQTLSELAQATSQNFPSKQDILTHISTLSQTSAAPAPQAATDTTQTWRDHAKTVMNHFVRVESTAALNSKKEAAQKLDSIAQAVNLNNFTLASQLSQSLPPSPGVAALQMKLQARATAQSLVQKAISQVNRALNPNGGLY